MSLLNQVLQDLDERAPVGESRPVRLSVAPAAHQDLAGPEDNGPDWARLGAGVAVIVAFVAAVWVFYGPGEQESGTKISPQRVSPPAVAASIPTPYAEPAVSPVPENDSGKVPGADSATRPAPSPDLPTTRMAMAADQENLPEGQVEKVVTKVSSAVPVTPAPERRQEVNNSSARPDKVSYLPLRNSELPVVEATPPETARVTPASAMPVKTSKSPPPGPVEMARSAIEQGELSSAEMILQNRLRLVPGDTDARELLVGLILRGGRYDTALQQLDQGLKQHPGHVKFSLIKARLLAQSGEVAAAVSILESSTPSTVGRVERLQMLGALYQQQTRYEQAVGSYRQLLQLKPSDGTAWVGLAISLDGLGDAAALEAYGRALRFGGLPAAAESYARQRFSELELTVD